MLLSYLETFHLSWFAWLLLVTASICLQHSSVVSAETLPADELYESKPCHDNQDCDVLHTFMTCTGQPKLCTCEPYRAGSNNVSQPFYSKQAGQCVIRVGQPCTLNPIAIGFGEYKCEPGANCRQDNSIADSKQYGRCSATGLVVGWLAPTLVLAIGVIRILKPY